MKLFSILWMIFCLSSVEAGWFRQRLDSIRAETPSCPPDKASKPAKQACASGNCWEKRGEPVWDTRNCGWTQSSCTGSKQAQPECRGRKTYTGNWIASSCAWEPAGDNTCSECPPDESSKPDKAGPCPNCWESRGLKDDSSDDIVWDGRRCRWQEAVCVGTKPTPAKALCANCWQTPAKAPTADTPINQATCTYDVQCEGDKSKFPQPRAEDCGSDSFKTWVWPGGRDSPEFINNAEDCGWTKGFCDWDDDKIEAKKPDDCKNGAFYAGEFDYSSGEWPSEERVDEEEICSSCKEDLASKPAALRSCGELFQTRRPWEWNPKEPSTTTGKAGGPVIEGACGRWEEGICTPARPFFSNNSRPFTCIPAENHYIGKFLNGQWEGVESCKSRSTDKTTLDACCSPTLECLHSWHCTGCQECKKGEDFCSPISDTNKQEEADIENSFPATLPTGCECQEPTCSTLGEVINPATCECECPLGSHIKLKATSRGESGRCVRRPSCNPQTPQIKASGNTISCVECLNSQHCPSGQVCNTDAGENENKCTPCTASSGCNTGQVCKTAANIRNNACVECTANSHCNSIRECDTASNQCCSSTQPYFSSEERECVECREDSHCSSSRMCHTVNKECCPSTQPYFSEGECVECTEDSHCTSPKTCSNNNTCTQAAPSPQGQGTS